MHKTIDYGDFAYRGDRDFDIKKAPTKVEELYEGKKQYKKLLGEFRDEIDELQNMMYAHNRYGLLLVFQAMDAAGKDGTIRHVMSGVNPHGLQIFSFKKVVRKSTSYFVIAQGSPERVRLSVVNYISVIVGVLNGGIDR
ncbi:MAG: polyphosphate kinase 2 family protein, partial [Bacteroidota bacterium]